MAGQLGLGLGLGLGLELGSGLGSGIGLGSGLGLGLGLGLAPVVDVRPVEAIAVVRDDDGRPQLAQVRAELAQRGRLVRLVEDREGALEG